MGSWFLVNCPVAFGAVFELELCKWCSGELGLAPAFSSPQNVFIYL